MPLRPIARPVDHIAVRVRGEVTLESLQHLLDSTGARSRRGLRHLFGRMEAPGGYNLVTMDVSTLNVAPQRGFRSIYLSLDVEWSKDSGDDTGAAVTLPSNQIDAINALLGALRRIELNEETECIASFTFENGETTPVISLPFPVALAVESERAVVQGVRVTGFEDTSASMMIDSQPDGQLHVSIGFASQILFGQQVTNRVIALATPFLERLVRPLDSIQLGP